MKSIALVLLAVAVCAFAQNAGVYVGFDPQNLVVASASYSGPGAGDFRALGVHAWPSLANARDVRIDAVSAERSTSQGQVDVASFGLATTLQCTIGFGFFEAQASLPNDNSATTITDVSAAAFAWAARAFYVFEWEDHDGNPGFQLGTSDIILGGYDLSSWALNWDLWIEPQNVTDDSGNTVTVWALVAATRDRVFNLRISAAGQPVVVNGVTIASHSIEVEYLINYFDNGNYTGATLYATGPSDSTLHPNSQLGLLYLFGAIGGAAISQSNNKRNNWPRIALVAGSDAGYFDYSPSADVIIQGANAQAGVIGSIQSSAGSFNVTSNFVAGWDISYGWFSFTGSRPSRVYWDPTYSSDFGTSAASSVAPWSAGVSVLIALVMLALSL